MNTTQDNTNTATIISAPLDFNLSYSYLKAIVSNDVETIKIPQGEWDLHKLVHGIGKEDTINWPIGRTQLLAYHSRRAIIRRVTNGYYIAIGQLESENDKGQTIRIDAVAISGGDWLVSWTPHTKTSCSSTIEREGRDAIPYRNNSGTITTWAMGILEEEFTIGDWTKIGGYISEYNSFRNWFEQFAPNVETESKIPASYSAYVKERANNARVSSEEQELLTLGRHLTGFRHYDSATYNAETKTFSTNRNCHVEMDINEARRNVRERIPFHTPYGQFRFHVERGLCTCGCHTFKLAHIEELVGLVPTKVETEKSRNPIVSATKEWQEGYRALNSWYYIAIKDCNPSMGFKVRTTEETNLRSLNSEKQTRLTQLFLKTWGPLFEASFGSKITAIASKEVSSGKEFGDTFNSYTETFKAVKRKAVVNQLIEGRSGAWQRDFKREVEYAKRANQKREENIAKRKAYLAVSDTLKAFIGDWQGRVLSVG